MHPAETTHQRHRGLRTWATSTVARAVSIAALASAPGPGRVLLGRCAGCQFVRPVEVGLIDDREAVDGWLAAQRAVDVLDQEEEFGGPVRRLAP